MLLPLYMHATVMVQILAVTSRPMAAENHEDPPAAPACDVPGFTFHPDQVPDLVTPSADSQTGLRPYNPIELYTLLPPAADDETISPGHIRIAAPLPNMAETLAACEANTSCGLFTSDGYIIGAYKMSVPEGSTPAQAEGESDIIDWQPMHYCTWTCCGTWVADGLIDQLLQPVPDTPDSDGVQEIISTRLPQDSYVDPYVNDDLRQDLSTTVCVGDPLPQIDGQDPPQAAEPGSDGCASRCVAACCGSLADGETTISRFIFPPCSSDACRPCGYVKPVTGPITAASSSSYNVLMRQYVRAQFAAVVEDAPVAEDAPAADAPIVLPAPPHPMAPADPPALQVLPAVDGPVAADAPAGTGAEDASTCTDGDLC